VEEEVQRLEITMLEDYTVKQRTVGKGVLARDQAYELGAVGPMLRGCGVAQDARQTGYAAYSELYFDPVVETGGDCYARSKVRFRETLASVDLIRRAVDRLPEGEVRTKVKAKGNPQGEAVIRVEQPRGELLYYIKGSGEKTLDRVRIRTPTFANIPPLLAMLPGHFLSDVPVVTLSIDPCISCTER
jgi:ech hydrogenase subunit E